MAILDVFCVIEGQTTSFSVEIESTKTVDQLKKAIKAEITDTFKGDAKDLALWRVSLPAVPKKDRKPILLNEVLIKEELDERASLSSVYPQGQGSNDSIIVQLPQSGNATH